MITDARPKAAPSQKTGELAAANITTAPMTAQTLKRLLRMRSTTLDCWAPAKSDQARMLLVRAGLGDSMAGARLSPRPDVCGSHQLPVIPGPPGYDEAVAQGDGLLNHDIDAEDRGPQDACGVFGVWAPHEEVAKLTYFGLYALQHRGQESAGIAVSKGSQIVVFKDMC